jgi:molybdopterin converting factor small subunit
MPGNFLIPKVNIGILSYRITVILQYALRSNMKVKVILYSTLREKLPPENNGRIELTLFEGCTISYVVHQLDLSGIFLCAINGAIERDMRTPIHDSDELRFFRPGSGGSIHAY